MSPHAALISRGNVPQCGGRNELSAGLTPAGGAGDYSRGRRGRERPMLREVCINHRSCRPAETFKGAKRRAEMEEGVGQSAPNLTHKKKF